MGRSNMSAKSALAEVKVAVEIALGDHGFGADLLNEKTPFTLVAVGSTHQETERLMQELEKLKTTFGNRIAIDGFVAPEINTESHFRKKNAA